MKKPNLKKMQAECDAFNAKCPVGGLVSVELDGVDEPFETVTISEAQILSGHSAVVWMKNVSGCYLLERVTPLPMEFYVISVKHSYKRDRYITFWRPDDKGYCYRLPKAGKYARARVMDHLGYYNTGESGNIAVPVDVVDRMTVMTTPADRLDGEDGPAVLNTIANWRKLINAVIQPPKYPCTPEIMRIEVAA